MSALLNTLATVWFWIQYLASIAYLGCGVVLIVSRLLDRRPRPRPEIPGYPFPLD